MSFTEPKVEIPLGLTELPDELIIKIFEYLNVADNLSCSYVNKYLFSISEDSSLWLNLLWYNIGMKKVSIDIPSYKQYYKHIYDKISRATIYDFLGKQYIHSVGKLDIHHTLYDELPNIIIPCGDCTTQSVIFLIDESNILQSIIIHNQSIKHCIILTHNGLSNIHNIVFISKISQPYQNDLCYYVLDMWYNFVLLCNAYSTIYITQSNQHSCTDTNIRFIMLPLVFTYDDSTIHIQYSHLGLIFRNIEGCISFEIKYI